MNANALIYEYAVLRYVPSIEREEFINVGLMMMCKRHRWLRTEVVIDRGRLLAFDPKADEESLRRQLAMFDAASGALAGLPVEERFRWFAAVKSCVVQTSRPHPGVISIEDNQSPGDVLETTFARLLDALVL